MWQSKFRKEKLEAEIEELEEELEGLEFSTYLYDVLTSEVEAKYVELSRLRKSWVKSYSYSVLPLVLLLYFRVL